MFIADDQPLAVIGIRSICATAKPLVEVVATTDSTSGLLDAPNLSACDVLVLDPQIADRDGSGTRRMALLRAIRSRYRRLPIVVLVLLENPAVVRELLAIGVRAVVSKRSPSWELLVAVRRAVSGEPYLCTHMRDLVSKAVVSPLSKREREVIRLLAQGLTVTEIAQRICRSVKTVSCHKANAMRKLGIHTHSQLFVYAREVGLDVVNV